MCGPALLAALGMGAGTTAAGATAAAATGSLMAAGGALAQGIIGAQAASAQMSALRQQQTTEAQLTASKDAAERAKFTSSIRQQTAELAARGVQLDSVTAVALGQSAAKQMSFQSQAIRSDGAATQAELSSQIQQARAARMSSILKGSFGAAGSILQGAPDLWPGFFQDKKALA